MRIAQAITDLNNAASRLITRRSPGKYGLLAAVRPRSRDLSISATWISAGKLQPLVDHNLALAKVRDAHSHVETNQAHGKVILVV